MSISGNSPANDKQPKALLYVQHLMGVGHVFRAVRIAAAVQAVGIETHIAYGGARVPGLDFGGATVHYLPALRAGSVKFSDLETPQGVTVDQPFKDDRRDLLLSLFEKISPDALIIEAFPFGRRQMRFELLPLLGKATSKPNPPMVFGSVRDILQENRKSGRDRETVQMLNKYFDYLLVHADPKFSKLGDTFPLANQIADKIQYTGLVIQNGFDQPNLQRTDEVLVSVGGGVMGAKLLEVALAARPLCSMANAHWCFVTGVNPQPRSVELLKANVGSKLSVETFLPDFQARLKNAVLSISRAGYNTVADIFSSGCRAIIVPISDGEETEQIKRAEILRQKNLVHVLMPNEETPQQLADAIDKAMKKPPLEKADLPDLNGAESSAAFIKNALDMRVTS